FPWRSSVSPGPRRFRSSGSSTEDDDDGDLDVLSARDPDHPGVGARPVPGRLSRRLELALGAALGEPVRRGAVTRPRCPAGPEGHARPALDAAVADSRPGPGPEPVAPAAGLDELELALRWLRLPEHVHPELPPRPDDRDALGAEGRSTPVEH